jgi:hypothetical protein
MAMDEQVSLRISSADLPLIEKVLEYRFKQGLLKKPTFSEYVRYLLNRDMTEVYREIQQRRS